MFQFGGAWILVWGG